MFNSANDMGQVEGSTKTIAKNTLVLYVRMLITIVLGLYTSRIVLNALGVIDYGVYNVVGGVVSMLTFLNVGMTGASQRFITFELGRNDNKSLSLVFSNCKISHYIIAIVIVLFFETFGVWLVNHKLVIPSERLFAAHCVLQCSIVTVALSVIKVPYNASIIAHERMKEFAYISVLEAVLKFLIAIAILKSEFDKLILYSILTMVLQFLIFIIYLKYCRKNFEECHCALHPDKKLLKEMISFASWGCVGNMGFSLKDQLSNIILNLFFGTSINAARGIAANVNGIINGFAGTFTTAMNPQIIKQYSNGNIDRSKDLALAGSRYSFYLLSFISIPFIINVDYVLKLWLGNVPEYTGIFVTIILIASCVYAMSHTISTAILATGRVKLFQSLLAIILLLDVPAAYIILKIWAIPYLALIPSIITNALTLIMRIFVLHRYIPEYSIRDYLYNTILKGVLIFAVALSLSVFIRGFFPDTFLTVVVTSLISFVIILSLIYVCGLNINEREFINNKIIDLIRKK